LFSVSGHVNVGPCSLWYGVTSGCGWRRWPPGLESSCDYIE